MRELFIRFNAFQLLDIVMLTCDQQINEHGTLMFRGHIDPAQEDVCLGEALRPNLFVRATAFDEHGEERTFFEGVLVDLQIEVENQLKLLTATLKTGSYLTDLMPHIRSFQSSNISYDTIMSTLMKTYQKGQVIMNAGSGTNIQGFTMQYLESDWAFAKRMASRFRTVLVPTARFGIPGLSFGLPQSGGMTEINTTTYSVSRNLQQMHYNTGHGLTGQTEGDMICYIYKSRELYELGDLVKFNRQPLYICAIHTELEGSEMYHTYTLATKDGLQVPEFYNDEVIGVSLAASVTAVQKDSVQVSIHNDENKGACGSRWLPYATVYSSPDGTGWYCMPEVGDSVRLYIPTEQEAKASVASSTHLQTSDGSRGNPDFKSIMNKQRKEVLFTPSSLLITNNAGMSIELSDAEGIKILSDKAIQIKSETAVDIASATDVLKVIAPGSVTLQQGSTQMKLQDQMVFKGAQVRLE